MLEQGYFLSILDRIAIRDYDGKTVSNTLKTTRQRAIRESMDKYTTPGHVYFYERRLNLPDKCYREWTPALPINPEDEKGNAGYELDTTWHQEGLAYNWVYNTSMSPEEYLAYARQGTEMLEAARREDWDSATMLEKQKLDTAMSRIQACRKMDAPILMIDPKTCEVRQHEGRHRSVAASLLGIERIPVVLYNHDHEPDSAEEMKRCEKRLKPQQK